MKSVAIDLEYRLVGPSEIYAEDEPEALDIDRRSVEWLRLIEADFAIYADGEMFYDGEVFPIAEFVYTIMQWIETGKSYGMKYSFDNSLNFEDQEGVVTIERENEGWRVSALWEEVPGGIWISETEFENKVATFVERARQEILETWGVDLAEVEEAELLYG